MSILNKELSVEGQHGQLIIYDSALTYTNNIYPNTSQQFQHRRIVVISYYSSPVRFRATQLAMWLSALVSGSWPRR